MSAISPVPKPTVIPQWAATTPGGAPASGTCVQPPSSSSDDTVISQQTGWIPGTAPPAQYDNYFKNLVCQWIAYLADINNQLFTDAGVGSWSQPHVFDAGVAAKNDAGPAITAIGAVGPAIEATSNTAAAAISATSYNGGTAIAATGYNGGTAIAATGGGALGSAAVIVTGTGEADGIQTTGSSSGTGITATGGEIFDALSITTGNHVATVTPETQAITTATGAVPASPSATNYYFAIPDGATLTGVKIWINCFSGTHTSWPVDGPAAAAILRWTINGGVQTNITGGASLFDPAANLAASNAGRAIAFTITGEPAFNRATTLYQVIYSQEAGSGSLPETITGIVVSYTPSKLSPAPV